jgi:hypothetical protein
MDPFERHFRRGVKVDAIVAFFVGVLAAYLIQSTFGLGGGGLLTTIIVAAVGGGWYHLRKVT